MFSSVWQLRETKTFQNCFNNKEYNWIYVQSVLCVCSHNPSEYFRIRMQTFWTFPYQNANLLLTVRLDFSPSLWIYVQLGLRLQEKALYSKSQCLMVIHSDPILVW